MKKLMISLAAMTAIGAAVPAAAQSYGYDRPAYGHDYQAYGRDRAPYGYNNPAYGNDGDRITQVSNARYNEIVQRRLQLVDMIARAERRGEISNWRARDLRSELGVISARANNSRRGGLTDREAGMAIAQLDQVAQRLDESRRAPRYSYGYNGYSGYNGYNSYDNGGYNRGW